jgi:hypothetical protein
LQTGAAAPVCKRATLSQQIDDEKRTGFGAGRGQDEGRLKFLGLKNLDVIDLPMFFNTPGRK